MPSFVITWKPERWPYEELLKLVQEREARAYARIDWRFRAYRRGKIGDQVFLMKQGKTPRGIFATGLVVAPPHMKTDDGGEEYPVATIEFDELVDPFTTLLVSERDTRGILPETVINTQFSGIQISDDAAHALKELIKGSAAARTTAQSKVPPPERFASMLAKMEEEGRLKEYDRDMLICHYNTPDHTLTGRQMSALMGWGGQSANRFYGDLGRRVAEELAWVPTEREGYDGFYVSGLILGSRPRKAFEWTMRPQVVRALELLKWPELKRPSDGALTLGAGSVTEYGQQYAWQKRLERDSRVARLAKVHHGFNCQACKMSFSDVYGDIGVEFIEAHHLIPLSDIRSGEERAYKPSDFAVLCSNCHRMIHRWPDPDHPRPSDIDGFTKMIQARKGTRQF